MPKRDEIKQNVPILLRVPPRVGMVRQDYRERGDTFTDGTGADEGIPAALAPFIVNPAAGIRDQLHLSARIEYVKNNSVVCRVNYATWLGEDFNFTSMTLRDTREIVLAVGNQDRFIVLQDNRHSVNKSEQMTVYELNGECYADVSVIDERLGILGHYSYWISVDPLAIHDVIAVPPSHTLIPKS